MMMMVSTEVVTSMVTSFSVSACRQPARGAWSRASFGPAGWASGRRPCGGPPEADGFGSVESPEGGRVAHRRPSAVGPPGFRACCVRRPRVDVQAVRPDRACRGVLSNRRRLPPLGTLPPIPPRASDRKAPAAAADPGIEPS